MLRWRVLFGSLVLLCLLKTASLAMTPQISGEQRKQWMRDAQTGQGMVRLRAIDRLGRVGVRAIAPLLRKWIQASSTPMTVMEISILSLGRLRDHQARKKLESLALTHPHYPVRRASWWALRQLRSKASIPVLLQLLQSDRSNLEKQYGVWALKAYRDPELAKRLYPLLLVMNSHLCLETWRLLKTLKKIKGRIRCSGQEIRARRADKNWLKTLQGAL